MPIGLRAKIKAFPCSIWLFAPSVLWKPNGFGSIRRKSILEADKFQLETESVTARESTFNFNTGGFTRAPGVLVDVLPPNTFSAVNASSSERSRRAMSERFARVVSKTSPSTPSFRHSLGTPFDSISALPGSTVACRDERVFVPASRTKTPAPRLVPFVTRSGHQIFAEQKFGGGGGNRTPVRRSSIKYDYMLSRCFDLAP